MYIASSAKPDVKRKWQFQKHKLSFFHRAGKSRLNFDTGETFLVEVFLSSSCESDAFFVRPDCTDCSNQIALIVSSDPPLT